MHSCIIAFFFSSFCEPHLVQQITGEIILITTIIIQFHDGIRKDERLYNLLSVGVNLNAQSVYRLK